MDAPPIIQTKKLAPPNWPRAWWWSWSAMAGAGLGAAAILFWFDPTQNAFYPRCALYAMTGLECPGCGSLRAMHALLHGHFLMALRDNALLVLSLPLVAWGGVTAWRRQSVGEGGAIIAIPGAWVKWLAAIAIVFTIARNIPIAPFTYLGPP